MNQRVPTADELRSAVNEFDEEWGAVDEVLYDLGRRHPGHDSLKHVIAKVALIGRGYASGIERCLKPAAGEQAIVLVGRYLHKHGDTVDGIIASVPQTAEPLDAAAMQCIVEQHGRLTALIDEMPKCARRPRSFASKYLHFHRPAVPIFDSYVAGQLSGMRSWSRRPLPFEKPEGADQEYWGFCVRLVLLLTACRDAGLRPNLKELDAWLWQVGRPSASARTQQRVVTVLGSQFG